MRSCSATCRPALAGALAAAGTVPGIARAHSPVAGFEGFYVGLVHPLVTPAQLLALLALGLLLGLRRRRGLGSSLLLFASAALAGIALGQFSGYPGWTDLLLVLLALPAAALAALQPAGPSLPPGAAEVPGGVLLGLASTPDPGPFQATAITLSGSFIGLGLTLAWITGLSATAWERCGQLWARMSLRILGAWLAAVCMLTAALTLASRSAA